MDEERVKFLCSISAALTNSKDRNEVLLKSYYLMRCKNLSKKFGIPGKDFSSKTRCPQCCVEWNNFSQSQLKPVKLSSKQRRKIKSHIKSSNDAANYNELLHYNELVLHCSLCKHKTVTKCVKPSKALKPSEKTVEESNPKQEISMKNNKLTKNTSKNKEMNVYSNTKEIFSLKNNKNSINRPMKPKIIKNNKKRKDKFAGLCKQAVLTVAHQKKDKLSLFLKPSS